MCSRHSVISSQSIEQPRAGSERRDSRHKLSKSNDHNTHKRQALSLFCAPRADNTTLRAIRPIIEHVEEQLGNGNREACCLDARDGTDAEEEGEHVDDADEP